MGGLFRSAPTRSDAAVVAALILAAAGTLAVASSLQVIYAALTALFWIVLELFSSAYFSSSIISDSRLYGTIGVVFTLMIWFIAIGAVIVLGPQRAPPGNSAEAVPRALAGRIPSPDDLERPPDSLRRPSSRARGSRLAP